MGRLELRPFEEMFLEDAGRLLAERHAAQRAAEPALPAAYEHPGAATDAIADLLSGGAAGAVATRDGEVAGFVLGRRRSDIAWGPNVWVEAAGHAARDPEDVRDLYAAAASRWHEEGRTSHYAVVPTSDERAVDAWFRLGFGHQHVHALRDVPAVLEPTAPPDGITLRPASQDDLDALAALDRLLPLHQSLAPCFSPRPAPPHAVARQEWVEVLAERDDGTYLAERGGRTVGAVLVCAIEESQEHDGLVRPPGAAFLAWAAVAPDARGIGIGQALAQEALAWARRHEHEVIVVDWRMTNLLASRAWPSAGYRPTFFRLHRAIA
jgi:ribosomal protein S18 acetylase RimI-like enzyme